MCRIKLHIFRAKTFSHGKRYSHMIDYECMGDSFKTYLRASID